MVKRNVYDEWEELRRISLMSVENLRIMTVLSGQRLPLQSVRWRLYLDILPIEVFGSEDDDVEQVWRAAIDKERKSYDEHRRSYVMDPDEIEVSGKAVGWELMNPLSLDEDSPWQKYYEDQDLRTTIMQDVTRTFPGQEYFRHQRVQKIMSDILFVYAKMHPGLKYRQGMHEILALLLLVVDSDSVVLPNGAHAQDPLSGTASNEACFFISHILDKRFVEHDAFALFDRLMRTCTVWYKQPGGSHSARSASLEAAHNQVPIVAQCKRMIEKLGAVDPVLSQHLKTLDIEPQLFGIRWYRLLFSREFSRTKDVIALWDILFSDNITGPLGLADWIGVVLLLANRDALVHDDYADCLSTLLHIPVLPQPDAEILERTPQLPNTPLPPQTEFFVKPSAHSPSSGTIARSQLTAVTHPSTTPIQRLALQAQYLRSRPTQESARAISMQYTLWLEESWNVVSSRSSMTSLDSRYSKALDDMSVSGQTKHAQNSESTPVGRGRVSGSAMSTPVPSSATGRKLYTSSVLHYMRTNSTSPPLQNAIRDGAALSASGASPPLKSATGIIRDSESTNNTLGVVVKMDGMTGQGAEQTPEDFVGSLGSLTAQVSSIAAQCVELLGKSQVVNVDDRSAYVGTISAALYTLSRVWQDEVVRSNDSTDRVRPREMSEADLHAMLRELDKVHVALSDLK